MQTLKPPLCVPVCECVRVFFHMLQSEDQNANFICKGRTFLGTEDILAGPSSFKGPFEG